LGYYARGNLTSSGAAGYGYTSENWLATGPNGAELRYDPVGRLLITNRGQSSETRFDYDGEQLIAAVHSSVELGKPEGLEWPFADRSFWSGSPERAGIHQGHRVKPANDLCKHSRPKIPLEASSMTEHFCCKKIRFGQDCI
jgi:YD repeat-containing protein